MNDAAHRGEIKRYVEKAFVPIILRMNDEREKRLRDLRAELAHRGHSPESGSGLFGGDEIEEDCIAELLLRQAELYLDAYGRKGLMIGPEVMQHIELSRVQIIGGRNSALIGEAQLRAKRTGRPMRVKRGQLGTKAAVAMREIAARIDLYNLTPRKADPMTVNNVTYHLVNSRVTHGDDHSVNIINESQLFDQMTEIVSKAIESESERATLLAALDELRRERNRHDYLTKLTAFLAKAASITHLIAPYLPPLMEKANELKHLIKS